MGKTKKQPLAESTVNRALAILKGLGKPATSREVSDVMGIKDPERGRALVRRAMAQLEKQGKVKAAKEGREFRFSLP